MCISNMQGWFGGAGAAGQRPHRSQLLRALESQHGEEQTVFTFGGIILTAVWMKVERREEGRRGKRGGKGKGRKRGGEGGGEGRKGERGGEERGLLGGRMEKL